MTEATSRAELAITAAPLMSADWTTDPSPCGELPDDPGGELLAGPVWFGDPATPLAGWVHVPPSPSGGAVVLCPPLFAEQVSVQHAYRCLARGLAAAGILTVRFDYQGTGDSAGDLAGPGLVARWLDDIDRAADLARSRAAGPLALVGMRMGATLAATAAERRTDVDALVLWDPCASGRSFLRRQQALLALLGGVDAAGAFVELPGVALESSAAREVGGLRLPQAFAARQTLVLERPTKGDGLLAEPGSSRGASDHPSDAPSADGRRLTRLASAAGEQEDLLDTDPFLRRLPVNGLDQVRRWLVDALSVPGPGDPRSTGATKAVGANEPALISVGTGRRTGVVRERVRWLGAVPLFAVETAPVDAAAADRLPTVVFLPTANDRHTGPSRLWVELAREWALDGYRCLRVDLSGLGESPTRPGLVEELVRPPEAFDDVADAVRTAGDDPSHVILVGLCSGAYQALESALELCPLGVLAINPLLRFIPPEVMDGDPVSPRRRICNARPSWVDELRMRLPLWVGTWAAVVRRLLLRPILRRAVEQWQGELSRNGVHVYCLCGPLEAAQVAPTGGRRPSPDGSGIFRVEVVEGLDHALLRASDRATAGERLTAQLALVAAASSSEDGSTCSQEAADLP